MATPTGETTSTQHAAAPFPPFQREHFASQLFWLAIAFVLLYALMSKVALPRVAGILQMRRERIAADLAEAQHASDESDAAIATYEKALTDARSRAQAIATETRERLAGEAEGSRKAVEARLNTRLADAERSIGETRTTAMSHVREVAVESAVAIVERLIGTAPAPANVAQAVDRALKS